jgi:hypothetical protein
LEESKKKFEAVQKKKEEDAFINQGLHRQGTKTKKTMGLKQPTVFK